MDTITFTFDAWQLVQVIVAVILPVIVGLVTRLNAAAGLKACLLAALSIATSIGTEALAAHQAGQSYDLGQALVLALGTFVIAVATHYGLWKPTGTSAAVGAIGGGDVIEGEVVDVIDHGQDVVDPDEFDEGPVSDLPDDDDGPEATELDLTPPPAGWTPQH